MLEKWLYGILVTDALLILSICQFPKWPNEEFLEPMYKTCMHALRVKRMENISKISQ